MTRLLTLCFLLFTFISLSAQFITTWTTTLSDSSITITVNPNSGSATVDYNINWGDNSDSIAVTGSITHKYEIPGTYAVSITGSFPGIEANIPADNALKLTSIDQWGTIQWKTMRRAFLGAQNMTSTATDAPNLSNVTDMRETFRSCSSFNGDIRRWNVSSITNMYSTFRDASSFNQDLKDWKVFNVTSMANMFQNASAFNQSLGDWEIRLVEEMENMLDGSGLTALNYDATLIGWEAFGSGQGSLISGVELGADGLRYLNSETARDSLMSKFSWSFLGDGNLRPFITEWNITSDGETLIIPINPDPAYTYDYDIDWNNDGTYDEFGLTGDASHPYSMGGLKTVAIRGDFPAIYLNNGDSAPKLTKIVQWGGIQWQSMDKAFFGASNMTYPAMDIPDLRQVTSMNGMFAKAAIFNGDLSEWNTAMVTDMFGMFLEATLFNGDISEWNTAKVTDMRLMFFDATLFNPDSLNWNTAKVTDMTGMFSDASSFNAHIGEWNTAKVTSMYSMFFGAQAFNSDISGWNTAKVTDMGYMFAGATAFDQPINTINDNWNTAMVTTMNSMFLEADAFNANISGWNTSEVTDMGSMFFGADAFAQTLGGWDISSVNDMTFMLSFSGLSQDNYDATLIGWEGQATTPTNITLDAYDLTYCAGTAAHQSLTSNTYNWTISGDTEDCSSSGPCTTLTTNRFIGDGDNNWNVGSNWSQSRIPNECDEVIIALDRFAILSGDALCYTIEIQAGGLIEVNGHELTVTAIIPNGN